MLTVVDSVTVFERHRSLLLGVAYRMLGSMWDAEDVVQDAYTRWARIEQDVRDPRALLLTVVDPDRARPPQVGEGDPGGLRRPVAARAGRDRSAPCYPSRSRSSSRFSTARFSPTALVTRGAAKRCTARG